MLVSILTGLAVAEAVVMLLLVWYTKSQATKVRTLEAASDFQQGVKAQLEVALATQEIKQEQDAKTDEVTAKSATTADAAAKLLASLHAGPRA